MKNIAYYILLIITFALTSCKDSSDEPDNICSGPWEIYLLEEYYGLHNNSAEFQEWFNEHQKYITRAKFGNWDNSNVWYVEGNDVLLSDYSWYSGNIEWLIIIENKSEEDIKAIISTFESFSITDDKTKKYDRFIGYYQKYEK